MCFLGGSPMPVYCVLLTYHPRISWGRVFLSQPEFIELDWNGSQLTTSPSGHLCSTPFCSGNGYTPHGHRAQHSIPESSHPLAPRVREPEFYTYHPHTDATSQWKKKKKNVLENMKL